MNRISKTLIFIGCLVISFGFIFTSLNDARQLIVFLGIFILLISFFIKEKQKKSTLLLSILILFLGTYLMDVLLVFIFNFNPIYSYKINSSEQFNTHYGLGYRVFECENEKYKDIFYQKSNYCNENLLETKEINSFSSELISSFSQYKNKFIILSGKVSYKEGNNHIELKTYSNEEQSLNGHVQFNDNLIYQFEFNELEHIQNLKVYDSVQIVGRISKLKKKDETYTIVMKDAYILDTKLYTNYKINVVEDKKCQKDKTNYVKTKDTSYYTSCLSTIYVIYNDKEVYELSYALKDEKITLENLLHDATETEKTEEMNSQLYKFDKYNILVCKNNNNVILGNKKLTLDSPYCDLQDLDEEEL